MNMPAILRRVQMAGHVVFTQPWSINLVAERHPVNVPNAFDDYFHTVMYIGDGLWEHRIYACTTDPGRYWLEHPMRVEGTAIIAPGQYRGAYEGGLHKGRPALVQVGEVGVYRDRNRDGTPDTSGPVHRGLFGINIHNASTNRTSTRVDKWSAGCIVFADDLDHQAMLRDYGRSAQQFGSRVTLTVL